MYQWSQAPLPYSWTDDSQFRTQSHFPIMDTITFRYLISLTISEGLDIRLIDVVATYLYGFIDIDIYMKILEGFKLLEND